MAHTRHRMDPRVGRRRWPAAVGFALVVAGAVATTTAASSGGATAAFTLSNGYGADAATVRVLFGPAGRGTPLVGNWGRAGSGRDSVGVSVPDGRTRRWLLASGDGSSVHYDFRWGDPRCLPVAGDWQGTGDTVGQACRQPDSDTWAWRLADRLRPDGQPATFRLFHYGPTRCTPVAGDWDGDGTSTVGVSCPNGVARRWLLTNLTGTGGADPVPTVSFDWGDAGCVPVTGDWDGRADGDTRTTVGQACRIGARWYWSLSDRNDAGGADRSFYWGRAGQLPVAGDWDGGTGAATPGLVAGLNPPAVPAPVAPAPAPAPPPATPPATHAPATPPATHAPATPSPSAPPSRPARPSRPAGGAATSPNLPSAPASNPYGPGEVSLGWTDRTRYLVTQLEARFPVRECGGEADGSGSGHVTGSDHYSGNAADCFAAPAGSIATGADRALGDAMAAWVVRNAAALKVKYVIWYGRIYDLESGDPGWQPYCNSEALSEAQCAHPTPGDVATNQHYDHVHISLLH